MKGVVLVPVLGAVLGGLLFGTAGAVALFFVGVALAALAIVGSLRKPPAE